MKKITSLLFLTLVLTLTSCEFTSEKSNTDTKKNKKILVTPYSNDYVSVVDYYESNMHYKVFISSKGVAVVNITKDSLLILKQN